MRKNLIYIFADQWRYHAMGYAKCDHVATPAFDDFAASSLFCTQALSTYPLSSPHRASLMTGKRPLSLGFYTNCKIGIADRVMLYPQETTISDVLYQEGYHTAYIGKWHLDAAEANFCTDPSSGARAWDAFTPPGERRHHFEFWYSYGTCDTHTDPHYWKDDEAMVKPGKWSPEHETDVLLDYLERVKDDGKPIVAFLSWNPPHPPYTAIPSDILSLYNEDFSFRDNVPKEWRNDAGYLEKRRAHFAAIEGLDRQFARIISYLKQTGLYENSTVVLSADHGDMMGSHGLYGKNVWYEESLRIPLVIHDPDLPCGVCDTRIVSEDQMPTFLELLGVQIPKTVEGSSQLSAMSGKEVGRSYSYHMSCPGLPEQQEPYRKLGLDPRSFGWRAIRDNRYKYVIDRGTEPSAQVRRLLYDLENDPYEMKPRLLSPSSQEAKSYDELIKKEMDKPWDFFLMED